MRTILLVEDFGDTTEQLAGSLQDEGCKVLTAKNAEEAISLLDNDLNHAIEGVLADYTLNSKKGGKTGMDIYDHLRTHLKRTDVAFGLMSGLPWDIAIGERNVSGDDNFLFFGRPFSFDKILDWISAIPDRAASPAPEKKPKILLIDDDVALRDKIQAAFEAAGFEVTAAGSKQEAMEAWHNRRPFDVIVSDQNFTGGKGTEFFDYTRLSVPRTPFILMSQVADEDVPGIVKNRKLTFFNKNYPGLIDKLLTKVKEVTGPVAGPA